MHVPLINTLINTRKMYVALNISNNDLRILSVKGRQVKDWGSHAITDGLVLDGMILQPQTVGEAIDALFKSTKIPKEKVITSLSGLSFTYRFLSLPRVKPDILEESILRAAKKEISLPLDELYLSWQALPSKGDEQTFFVLGVPRNLVDAMVQALTIAGVEPYLMDLRPLAIARAANRRDAIVASLESDGFDIVFVADGIPSVIHTVSPRSEGTTLDDNIQRLADELTKTEAFYQSGHPENQLGPDTPLLLTGELAAEAPTTGLLQAEIEYQVEPLIASLEFPPDLPIATYTANIGLVLKKIPQKSAKDEVTLFHDININILSGKYRKSGTYRPSVKQILLGIFTAIVVILLFPFYQMRSQLVMENLDREHELQVVSRLLNLTTLAAEETIQIEETILEINKSQETLKEGLQSIMGTRGDFTGNLQVVSEVMPLLTCFTSMEIDREMITVQGETDSVFTVVNYATNLEAEDTFSEVRITSLDEAASAITAGAAPESTTSEESVIIFEIRIDK